MAVGRNDFVAVDLDDFVEEDNGSVDCNYYYSHDDGDYFDIAKTRSVDTMMVDDLKRMHVKALVDDSKRRRRKMSEILLALV